MIIYGVDNRFIESSSPHSLGLQNDMTVPNPGFDQNEAMINEKKFWGAGLQSGCGNCGGMGSLSFDGTGLFGTGLFSGDITTWGVPEVATLLVGYYLLHSILYTTSSHAKSVHGAYSSYTSKQARRKKLQAELESL